MKLEGEIGDEEMIRKRLVGFLRVSKGVNKTQGKQTWQTMGGADNGANTKASIWTSQCAPLNEGKTGATATDVGGLLSNGTLLAGDSSRFLNSCTVKTVISNF